MGREGRREVVVDSAGPLRRRARARRARPGPGPHHDDRPRPSDVAEEQLAATKLNGRAVVIDPRNGEILALVSHPSYDPNLFAGGITPDDYAKLRDNPDQTAAQPRHSGHLSARLDVEDRHGHGGPVGGGDEAEGGHPVRRRHLDRQPVRRMPRLARRDRTSSGRSRSAATATSTASGFGSGVDKINKWATAMGFGKKTGIDLPNETARVHPDAQHQAALQAEGQARHLPMYRWNDIDTVHASIGQGYDRPTPLQMVHAFAGIAMNGHFTTPHLLQQAKSNGA